MDNPIIISTFLVAFPFGSSPPIAILGTRQSLGRVALLYSPECVEGAFSEVHIQDPVLVGLSANLRDADLRGANLSGADLSSADLRGANLSDTKDVTEEKLEEQAATLKGATMPDGSIHR